MDNGIGETLNPVGRETGPRRTELERQLSQAIRRAELRYRQVSAPETQPASGGNPPHLGTRVDVRI